MTMHDDEMVSNPSDNESFVEVLDARLSRRALLGGGVAAAAAGVLGGGVGQLLAARPAGARSLASSRGEEGRDRCSASPAIPTSTADTVVVPQGYTWKVLDRLG